MKIRSVFSIILILLEAMTIQSCSTSNDTVTASELDVYKDSVSINTLDFPISSGSAVVGIKCDADWNAEVLDTSWVNISNHAGYGYADKWSYIKVAVSRNATAKRSTQLIISSGNLSKVVKINQNGATMDSGDPFESAYSLVSNIKLGYNLGNTLDANPDINQSWFNPKTVYDWETSWGQPITTQAMIDAITTKGFNIIRVPVTWYPHIDTDGNVDEAWMNRVEDVVKYVLKSGAYCILNVQHDCGAKDASRKDDAGWLVCDANRYSAISTRLKSLWKQIATRFKDYDEKLIFEAFNEILDSKYEWGDPTDANACMIVNKLEQDFVDAVRATGSKNEYRNLVCNPYGAGSTIPKLKGFAVPNDKHPNHIVASIHSYDPYNFCNDAGTNNISVFDSSCEKEVSDVITRTSNRFDDLGIPFFLGEFGAIDEKKSMSERIKYAKYAITQMRAKDTTGLWWMGLYDRNKNTWYESEIVDALLGVSSK